MRAALEKRGESMLEQGREKGDCSILPIGLHTCSIDFISRDLLI